MRDTSWSVVAVGGSQLLDLAVPVEVLRVANDLGDRPRYRTLVATVAGSDVRSDSCVRVGADLSLGARAHGQ